MVASSVGMVLAITLSTVVVVRELYAVGGRVKGSAWVFVVLLARQTIVKTFSMRIATGFAACLLLGCFVAAVSWAQEGAADPVAEAVAGIGEGTDPVKELQDGAANTAVALDTFWVLLCGFLVMWMQAGFGLVESGLTRAKNAVNICMKNLLDFCFGSVFFWLIGWGLMFGNGNGFVGTEGLMMLRGDDNSPALAKDDLPEEKRYAGAYSAIAWTGVPLEAKFFFQLVFAATAATIVSGAMAERTRFGSYMIFSAIITAVIYPISGHWIWGGGWLQNAGFWDFAGSTTVHSVGGWLALVGAFVLGPRAGKYNAEGKAMALPGHNLVFVMLGVFILWLGWFGFNPGSTMSITDNPTLVAKIVVVTNASAALGALLAMITAKVMFKKWEATMALNGALAGLVAITAPCAWIDVGPAMIVGACAGVLVVLSVVFFDQVAKIDDPVGAISVHGVCGAFGTICLGLFSNGNGDEAPTLGLLVGGDASQLIAQLMGVVAVAAWCLVTGAIVFYGLKYTVGLRVTKEEELEGLDYGEHGNEAYHGFQFTD
jgi:ammonium transporter, Amt family